MTDNRLLLFRLAELMLEQEKHMLLVDELFDDELIGDYVKSIQIDSPYQQLLMEGVLTESVREEKLFISFTVEGYFHFILGEVIFQNSSNKDYSFLTNLIENNSLNGVKEGVEQCLIKEVTNGRLERLVSFVDKGGEAELVARYPLVHAFMKNNVDHVFQILMENPTIHDWNIIKHVRGILIENQKNLVLDQLDAIIKESVQLKNTIDDLFLCDNELEFHESLTLISIYTELNALDQAKNYFNRFIVEAEKRNYQDSLVEALEKLGDSEYKRSGQDGYKAAMEALSRAAEMRESETLIQKDKLKNTYRLLGFAYLSLGLQVVKSTEYFEKSKSIMLEESSDSVELAEINLYIGIVNFWRGLRGIGRWGHADSTLLEGVEIDLFEYANEQFQLAFNYHFKHLGKTHPQTLKAIHYLQENRYAMGNYEKAIPWLKKYVEVLPFKTKEHTDNFYFYSLIVSLEEYAKEISSTNKDKAMDLINEALNYILKYDENQQIANRLLKSKHEIEIGELENIQYTLIKDLPSLKINSNYKGVWSKWRFSEQLIGFQTNNSMVDANGIWFFHLENKQLIYWDKSKDSLNSFSPTNWPDGCGRFVYDNKNQIFYSWSSIRSTVYELISPEGNWKRMSFGVHDVHACGASFGYDQINNRLYEFGGYGYFTYKNWLWVYDITDMKWTQLKENKPGIAPYPRNGQLIPIENGTKSILISGIGNDTGIQREHKPRMGLGSATDVGFFTWLRDAHELDLNTMEWKTILPANHESIRHEGTMGYIDKLNMIVNWSGIVPSPIFGEAAEIQKQLSCWQLNNTDGFNNIMFDGDDVPQTDCVFVPVKDSNELLLIHAEGIWKLSVYDI